MKKKLLGFVSIMLLLVLVLSACGGTAEENTGNTGNMEDTGNTGNTSNAGNTGTTEGTDETTDVEETPFRVGFVTDTGGINDDSFNETQWAGILAAAEEVSAIEAQYIQSDAFDQFYPNLTEFTSQGYDMVIAAGFFLGADLAKVAGENPDINFSIFDYNYPNSFDVPEGVVGNAECIPNVMGQVFKTDQAAYLAGYLAAGMTKTGKIGFFGGAKIPTVVIFAVGMEMGIDKYNEVHGTNVELIGWSNETGEGSFTGDFVDLTKGKEYGESLFDEGADIVAGVGGLIGSPVFDTARERGGYGIWVDTDGYFSLTGVQDVILTSIMKNMERSMKEMVITAYEGNFQGCTDYIGDLANGGVDIAPFHDLESEVPAELAAEIEALRAQIVSGEISDTGCLSYPDFCPPGVYVSGD